MGKKPFEQEDWENDRSHKANKWERNKKYREQERDDFDDDDNLSRKHYKRKKHIFEDQE